MMELDSQSMTPPSSPMVGVISCEDEQSWIDSGEVYCLNCKGPPRLNDFSFSSDGYILRREVISAIANLGNGYIDRSGYKPKLLKCFGYLFDPYNKDQVKNMILICRKKVASLEVLSESSHSFSGLQMYDVQSASHDPDELCNQDPWTLRKNVCQFLNIIVRGLKYYRTTWKLEEFHRMFTGLKKSLVPIQQWSSVLKTHNGFKGGNETCSSATYHFFHMQLDLRWSLFLIFGATPSMASWLFDDLIQLALFNYNNEAGKPLDEKQTFNCVCVKEIWTMVRLVLELMEPEPRKEKPFWNLFVEAMQRVSGSDSFFSIWLTSHMAPISDYCAGGLHRPGQGRNDSKENGNNAYPFVHGILKEWVNRGGKSAEVLKLTFNFFQHWGGDCDTLVALWTQWVPRLDRGNDVSNFESYSSIDNWLKLISKICENSAELCGDLNEDDRNSAVKRSNSSRGSLNTSQTRNLGSNKDPFLEFIFLVAAYSRWATEKEIKKLKSNICMKLSRNNCNTSEFGEIGIIRVASLFMALSTVIEFEGEAVSMCDRLQDMFVYGKSKNTPGRRKAILRTFSCMIIILLRKKISLNDHPSVALSYMKTVDELLCQSSSSSDSSRKEIIMVYIDLLDSIPKHSPILCSGTDLGRYVLISSNLSMWFTNAGHNYVVRTARCLSQITEWIVKWAMDTNLFIDSTGDSEGRELFLKISEKSLPFMKSIVILNSNRIPSTDVEPIACLAADITLLTKRFKRNTEEYESHYDLFAMNEHTCPLISQYFIQRLFKNNDFIESSFSLVKWIQTWIRLLALDCFVPDELTEIVLSNSFSSTSNQDLLREFCKNAEKYDRDQIQTCLMPLVLLLKGVITATLFKDEPGQTDGANVIKSVITSCGSVFKNIRFDYLYIKGNSSSVAHQILNLIAPSAWPLAPWEKYSPALKTALEKNVYEVFEAVALYPGLEQDPVLCRKLQDIVVLSFFGFLRAPEQVDRNKHPAIRILDLSEDQKINLVQNKILPEVIAGDQVVKDLKLCQMFLSVVQIFRSKQLATAVMRVLPGVIRAYIIHCNSSEKQTIMNCCINAVVYCCLVGSSNSVFHRKLVVDGFTIAFEKEFLHRGRIVFQLCLIIAKSKNSTNGQLDAKRFLKVEIIPLLRDWVEKCEQRRGIGRDKSLRDPLEKLEFETAAVPVH